MIDTASPLVAKRAQLLARLILTRQPSVVTEVELGDLDLLVHLYPDEDDKNKTVPVFGVLVYGTDQAVDTEERAGLRANGRWHNLEKHRYVMPVLVLLFSMQHDEGYFAWANEPIIHLGSSKFPGLLNRSHLEFKKATSRSVQQIFSQIREWYSVLAQLIFEE